MIDETQYPPIIGNWYRDELGQLFEIVAVDEHDSTIEVQFQDGTLAEYDLEAWESLAARPAAPPEDEYAAYDDVDKEFRSYSDETFHPQVWSSALDDLEKMDW